MMRSRLSHALLSCSLVASMLFAALPASADGERGETAPFHRFTKLVVFGDSLSDTGNVFAVTRGAIPPPSTYYAGRFSNGPVWVEYLAEALDLPFENYAYGGALTDTANLFDGLGGVDFPGLRDEIDAYTGRPEGIDRRAIYLVWAGANDFRAALSRGQTPDIQAVISNLLDAVDKLYADGARYVVVPNLPDLGLTPEGLASGAGPFITLLSATFNEYLAAALTVHAAASRPRGASASHLLHARRAVSLGLGDPPRHAHLAEHCARGAEMLSGLRLLAGAPMKAAKAEMAVRDERTHAERAGGREGSAIGVVGARDIRARGGDFAEDPRCPRLPSVFLSLSRELAGARRDGRGFIRSARKQPRFGEKVQDRRTERRCQLRGALE